MRLVYQFVYHEFSAVGAKCLKKFGVPDGI
jgi:hypothetical protein